MPPRQELAIQQKKEIAAINSMLLGHKEHWKQQKIQGFLENETARRKLVFDMRRTGMSYREIAEFTKLSHSTIMRDIKAVLEEYRQEMLTDTHEYIITELDRLDKIQTAFWEKTMLGDFNAGKMVLDAMKLRATLLGIGTTTNVIVKEKETIETNTIQIQYVSDWRNPELVQTARDELEHGQSEIIDYVPGDND